MIFKRSYKHFLNLILLLTCAQLPAQNGRHIIGKITDIETQEPLYGVVCKIMDNTQKELIAYALSDENGKFKLTIEPTASVLVFECLGYDSKNLPINQLDLNSDLDIKLTSKDFQLKEVTVRVPPILQNNDTISYNVSQFQTQSDKYIGDILKKLPGININQNGIISYQGEPINKFYIDGHDLLGGQYGIATNNLSADAIAQVQVLENNQHIKALKGVEFSEKAAINLKLKKKFLVKPFGEVQVSIGGGDKVISDDRLFATQLGTNVQTITNFKGNNTGNNILTEIEDKLDYSNTFSYELLPISLIHSPKLNNISIPLNRYLKNKTILAGINNLIGLNSTTELRLNLSYAYDQTNQDFLIKNNYAMDEGNNLSITELSQQIMKNNNYWASITLEHNGNHIYIKNESKSVGAWQQNKDNTISNNRIIQSANNNDPIYVQNNFQGLIKYDNDKTINFNSFFRYIYKPEYLQVNSTDSINENITSKSWLLKNKVNTTFNIFHQRLDLGAIWYFKSNNINSDQNFQDIKIPLGSEFGAINNQFNQLQIGFSPSYQIKYKKLTSIINIPVTYKNYKIREGYKYQQTDQRILVTPSISNYFTINHLLTITSRLSYDWDYDNEMSLLNNSYFTNYRSIYIPSGDLNTRNRISISTSLKYKDIIRMLFFNISILYNVNKYNYTPKLINTDNWSTSTSIQRNNFGKQFLLLYSISKSLTKAKTTLSFSPTFSQFSSELIQQDRLIKNKNNLASLSLNIEVKTLNKINFNYQAMGKMSWQDNNTSDKSYLKDWSQIWSTYYFPTPSVDLLLRSDYTISEISKADYRSYLFLDFKVNFRCRKMEFIFSADNILDKKNYSVSYWSTVNSTYQNFPLRRREFLLTAKTKF